MTLHFPTLLVMAAFAIAVASLLLLLSWLQNRGVQALALWAGAFLASAVGVALISARGDIPNFWSITLANAFVAAGYGLLWGGARDFGGRAKSLPIMVAGALVWMIACQFEWFFETLQARVTLMSAIIVAYSVSCAWEFWRASDEPLIYRLPIIAALLAHAVVVLIRIPLSGSERMPVGEDHIHVGWWTFVVVEAAFFAYCGAYLLGGLHANALFFGTSALPSLIHLPASATDVRFSNVASVCLLAVSWGANTPC